MTTAKELLEAFDEEYNNTSLFSTFYSAKDDLHKSLLSALRQAQESVRPTSLPTHNMIYKKQGYTWNEFDLLQKKFWEGVE